MKKMNPPKNMPGKPVSRRKFLFKAATGLAAALGVGYAIKEIRFRKWQNNVHLDFIFERHETEVLGRQYAQEIDAASASGNPYNFVVIENWNLSKAQRAEFEKTWNIKIQELRNRHLKQIK